MGRAVRSPRGVAGAAAFLLAFPLAALCQLIAGTGGVAVIHLALALGAGLMAIAVFDFRTALKVVYLLPFVWLFLEATKTPHPQSSVAAP